MENFVIYQYDDFAQAVNDECLSRCKKIKALRFEFPPDIELVVTVNVDAKHDKHFKKAFEDPQLLKDIKAPLDAESLRVIEYYAKLMTLGQDSKDNDPEKHTPEEWAKKVKSHQDSFARMWDVSKGFHLTNLRSAAENVLQEYKTLKADWKSYKVMIAVDLVENTTMLAVNIAVLASTPFHFGAGTVFSILGMIKSAKAIAHDCNRIAMDLDTALGKLWKHIQAIQKQIKDVAALDPTAKKLNMAQMSTAQIVNAITGGLSGIKFFPDHLAKATEFAVDTEAKFKHQVIELHRLAKKFKKASDMLKKVLADKAATEAGLVKAKSKKKILGVKIPTLKKKKKIDWSKIPELEEKVRLMEKAWEDAGKALDAKRTEVSDVIDVFKEVQADCPQPPKFVKALCKFLEIAPGLAAGMGTVDVTSVGELLGAVAGVADADYSAMS